MFINCSLPLHQKHSNHTSIILLTMKIAATNASKKSKAPSKGQRFVPVPVTDIKWSESDIQVYRKIAAAKLGLGDSELDPKLRDNHEEVIKIALNCYGAKDLAFILSSIGYNQQPYPKGKRQLVSTIIELLLEDARLGAYTAPTEPGAVPATAKSTKASSEASLVSISPGLMPR